MKIDAKQLDTVLRSHDDIDPVNGGEGVRKFLRRDARVTEEQLFGASVEERLTHHAGEEVAQAFQRAFRKEKSRLRALTGERSVETAALNALESLTETGEVLESVRNRVYNQAFRMAQIDSDPDSLNTAQAQEKAFTTREEAIELANDRTFLFISELGPVDEDQAAEQEEVPPWTGEPTESSQENESVDVVPSSNDLGVGLRGFLWKPESESDGNLVVLMPSSLTDKVKELGIVDSSGEIIEEGRYTGTANGNRDHFRFDRPGSEYDGGNLLVTLDDNSTFLILIDDPAQREER